MTEKKETKSPRENKLKCGIAMPISQTEGYPPDHWEDVRSVIKEALQGSDFETELVSFSDDVGIIQSRIVNNIYRSEMMVCDVSSKNPNVMFELGLRLAFDKPTVIIKDELTNYSFDTSPIEHLEYPSSLRYSDIVDFKKSLRLKVEKTYEASLKKDYRSFLQYFGQFKISKIEDKEVTESQYITESLKEIKEEIKKIKQTSQHARNIKFNTAEVEQVAEDDIQFTMELLDIKPDDIEENRKMLLDSAVGAVKKQFPCIPKFLVDRALFASNNYLDQIQIPF